MNLKKPEHYEAIISEKNQLTSTIYHVRFSLPLSQTLLFTPGQYATVVIDSKIRRQYSFCSDPYHTKEFEMVIDVAPMGPGSKFFLEKAVGDTVAFLGPLGTFRLADTPMKKVLIATGTGIAPFRSMLLNEVLRSSFLVPSKGYDELSFTTKELTKNKELTTRNFSLYWGLRHEEDMYWDKELKDLVGQLVGFQYFMSLSKPSEKWTGLVGHVTDHVLKQEHNWEMTEFYLCGNRSMIDEMMQKLSAHNVKKEQIKTDLFY